MTVDVQVWKDVLREVITTHVDEMSCTDCYAQVDLLAELVLRNEDTRSILPRVHDHLEHCRECWEEFQALLSAVRATAH